METVLLFWLSFLAGIYALLGSPCVLVLYPGYLAFLAGRAGTPGRLPWPLIYGIAIAAGTIIGLLAAGILFLLVVAAAGDFGRLVLDSCALALLVILAIALILDLDAKIPARFLQIPRAGHPLLAAFAYGLCFGIIILPCNAPAVAVIVALALSASGFFIGLGSFFCFGLGITAPLLLLAGLSQAKNREILSFLSAHRRAIRTGFGLLMLAFAAFSLYALFFLG